MKTIVILATLDTKSEEAAYLRRLIEHSGHHVLIMDIGCGAAPKLAGDVPAEEIAAAAGVDIEILRSSRERETAVQAMIRGAIAKLQGLCDSNSVEGIISIGGMSSAGMASDIYRAMPYHIPKVLLTSAASLPQAYRFFGPSGVTVMQCMVEVGGLNRILRTELARAAAAICGMATVEPLETHDTQRRPMVAMSTNGMVEHAAQHIIKALEPEYEVVRFHATGLPEVVMERLIDEGYFTGVIDLVPSSITNEKYGGTRLSWPRRLEVAGEAGIPQVIAPCYVNVISRSRDSSPELASELELRKHYFMDALRVLLWLTPEEVGDIAPLYAEKLNRATGPTRLLIPLKGWAEIETEETGYYDPGAIEQFTRVMKGQLRATIGVEEVDANIDSPLFAEAVVRAFLEIAEPRGK